uniref:Bromo domain-containing protein n=1 Tax=Arion vulgaris TaxID=1028688 RepID=A0A0B7B8R6_9EUPU
MGSKKHKKHKLENKSAGDVDSGQEKPLKLKLNLKVGIGASQESVTDMSPTQGEERRHKHKKKKKKKSSDKDRERSRYVEEEISLKRPHEDDESAEDDDEDDDMTMHDREELMKPSENKEESDGNISPSRKLREPRSCTLKDGDGVILKQMLNYLLKNLQNKDVNGFFAFPVTDNIAPGYSSIIIHPMDFSTMALKIEAADYANVMDFKKDFILMCNNAMTYNRQDTIYYKEAKRLLHIGIRQLSKEKLLHLKKTQSFLTSITLQELGFDESGHSVESSVQPVVEELKDKPKEEPRPVEIDTSKLDAIADDDLLPEEILAQAQEAAQSIKHELTTRKPKSDFGFLRLDDDGTTSMTILNPWNDGVVSSNQKVISLGDYMGKLKSGSGSLFKFKEDKRNKVCPETYLCYGPFSSHAPSYDSSFATCSKEESDLLLNTYGGEIGVQYAKSVQKFVECAGLSAVEMVDKLLDTLTNGQHSKSRVLLEQQKRREDEQTERALQDEMIMRAQKAAEEVEKAAAKDSLQHKLNETANMLSELSDTQHKRLSQDPPTHLSLVSSPTAKEADLANKVTSNLMNMAKQVHPRDVVSSQAVRAALGITAYPVSKDSSQDGASSYVDNTSAANVSSRNVIVCDDVDDDDDSDDDEDSDEDENDEDDSMNEDMDSDDDEQNKHDQNMYDVGSD